MLGIGILAWSGRWRGWVSAPALPAAAISFIPGFGILLLAVGISRVSPPAVGAVLFILSAPALPAGFILSLWNPDWFGPRWYREHKRAFGDWGPADPAWIEEDRRRPGESSIEATERHFFSGRPPPPCKGARLVTDPGERLSALYGRRGLLMYYPQAPVFSVKDARGKRVREIIPTEGLVGACRLRPGRQLDGSVKRSGLGSWLVSRVRIDTTEGPWLFQATRSGRVVREIERRYVDPSRVPDPSYTHRPARRPGERGEAERPATVAAEAGSTPQSSREEELAARKLRSLPGGSLLRSSEEEITREVPGDPETVLQRVRGVLSAEGNPLNDGDPPESGVAEARASIGAGAGGMIPTVVSVRVRSAGDGSCRVTVRGTAQEGLIKHGAARKAVQRVAERLEGS